MTQQDDITQRVLTDDEIMQSAISACDSLNITRFHEIGAPSKTIMDDAGLLELGRAIETAVLSQVHAPVADEPVPYPKREDVTPEMRASFERLFSEARKHHHGTLARNDKGAYRDLRVDADWVFYQRAWADALASAPVAGEAQKPVAWMLIGRLKNSEPKFTLSDPAGIYESVYAPLYAAPQAGAEDDREGLAHKVNLLTAELLGHRSAAGHLSALVDELRGHLIDARQAMADFQQAFVPAFDTPETLTMVPNEALAPFCAALDRLCELDLPQADKDGGQWEPQTPEQIAADMRNMARSEGFDWPEPDGGQQRKRYVVLKASGSRYAYVNDTQEGRSINRFDVLKGEGWKYAHELADRMNKEHERAALSAPQAEQGERDA